jgi:hypothetical protein
MTDSANVELLLRRALAPVEPPEDFRQRVESTLQSITAMAADELEGWELASMRDPRNWGPAAAALVAGSAAGAALVVLRVRQRHKERPASSIGELRELAERAAQEIADETRKLLDSR